MGNTRSLDELRELADSSELDEIKKSAAGDPGLKAQLSFSTPNRSLIHREDLAKLDKGRVCVAWGRDPDDGRWYCIKWK